MSTAGLTSCAAGCGAKTDDTKAWDYLWITGRYRCWPCTHALAAAGKLVGDAPTEFTDALPPNSRGALRKATAHTVTPPVVNPNTGEKT